MNVIRLAPRFSEKEITDLLVRSPLQSFGAARCADYLASRGITVDQIRGSFLAARIAANNVRAERYWRARYVGSVHSPSPVSVVTGAVLSRVLSAGRSGSREMGSAL